MTDITTKHQKNQNDLPMPYPLTKEEQELEELYKENEDYPEPWYNK